MTSEFHVTSDIINESTLTNNFSNHGLNLETYEKLKSDEYGKIFIDIVDKIDLSPTEKSNFLDTINEILEATNSSSEACDKAPLEEIFKLYTALTKHYNNNEAILVLNYFLKKENLAPEVINNDLSLSKILKQLHNVDSDKDTVAKFLNLINDYDLNKNNALDLLLYMTDSSVSIKAAVAYKCAEKNNEKISDYLKKTIENLYKFKNLEIDDSELKALFNSILEIFDRYKSENYYNSRNKCKEELILLKDEKLSLEKYVALNFLISRIYDFPDVGIGELYNFLKDKEIKLYKDYDKRKVRLLYDLCDKIYDYRLTSIIEDFKNSPLNNIIQDSSMFVRKYPHYKNEIKNIILLYSNGIFNLEDVKDIFTLLKNDEYKDKMDVIFSMFSKIDVKCVYSFDEELKESIYIQKEPFYIFLYSINVKFKSIEEKLKFALNINNIDNKNFILNYELSAKDLNSINNILKSISSSIDKKNFMRSNIATLLAQMYIDLKDSTNGLTRFRNTLTVLDNMAQNSSSLELWYDNSIRIVEDCLDGKADDFINKNLYNNNIEIFDYINFLVKSSKLTKENVNRIISLADFCDSKKDAFSILYNLVSFADNNSDSIEYVLGKIEDFIKLDTNNNSDINLFPKKSKIINSMVANLAHPYLISQYSGTCLATSLEFDLCKYHPTNYVDIMLSLYDKVAKNEISYKTIDEDSEEKSKYYFDVAPASVFFQIICTNLYNNECNKNTIKNNITAKTSMFKNFGYMLEEEMINKGHILTQIDNHIEQGKKIFMSYHTETNGTIPHASIIISANRNNDGEIVSYNVYHGWQVHQKNGRLDIISKRFLERTIRDAKTFTFDSENITILN